MVAGFAIWRNIVAMRQKADPVSEHLKAALEFLGREAIARPKPARGKAAGTRRQGTVSARGAPEPTEQPILQTSAIDQLARKLDVAEVVVLDVSRIPLRTFHRRQSENQPLTATEADRVLRIARVAREAERVFGDARKARQWLTTPSAILGEVPLRLLSTDAGARDVEAELGRIDWGEYA